MAKRDGILALDLASAVGWAICPADYRPLEPLGAAPPWKPGGVFSGSWRVAPPGTELAPFLDRFYHGIDEMIAFHAPSIVAFEAPILHAGHTSIDTARKLMAMAALTGYLSMQSDAACRGPDAERAAEWATKFADALIAELDKEKKA